MPHNALHEALEHCLWRGQSLASAPDISALIADNPDSLMEKDIDGFTPLFSALYNGASLAVVQVLINACPDAILECIIIGALPIQYMLRTKRFSFARALINANTTGLKLGEKQAGLPLHVAVQHGVDDETFNMILDGYPEACVVQDGHRRVPLECALHTDIIPAFEVIERLVRAFPEALKIKDNFLLQRICARYSLPGAFISTVQDNCPEAFLASNNGGHVPLHYAMRRLEVEDEVGQTAVLTMIRACPEAATVAAGDGQLPLHWSMGHLNVKGVNALVEANPDAVLTKGGEFGKTPLHLLLEHPETFSFEVAKVLVAARSDVLMVKDEAGNIPFSTAVTSDAVLLPTVEWLIIERPESIEVANNRGQIPLHIAVSCDTSAPLELIRMLYHAWPDSIKQLDSDGMLPLSLAVIHGSQQTVELLYGVYPEAAMAKDSAEMVSLHHAVHGHGRQEKLQFLLGANPEAARIKDNLGMLPVHHAVHHGSLDAATALVAAWPDGLKERTVKGNMPLFLAFKRHDFNQGIGKLLLETRPDSVKCTNRVGDLPIHMVSRLSEDFDATLNDICTRAKYLIDTWPESLLRKNPAGDLPLHVLLFYIKDAEQLGRKRKRDDIINDQLALVRLFVSKCPESVEVVDGDGNIPLITACDNPCVSLDVIDFLVRASMNVLLIANRRRRRSVAVA